MKIAAAVILLAATSAFAQQRPDPAQQARPVEKPKPSAAKPADAAPPPKETPQPEAPAPTGSAALAAASTAERITSVASAGCVMSDRWPASTLVTFAPARFVNISCSASGIT